MFQPELRLKVKLWSRTLVIAINLIKDLIMHTIRQEYRQTVMSFVHLMIRADVIDLMVTEDEHRFLPKSSGRDGI